MLIGNHPRVISFANHLKVISFFHFELRHAQVINTISVPQTIRFLTNIKVMISPNPNFCQRFLSSVFSKL